MPSRGRPELCKRSVGQAKENATGEIEILVYVDSNDPEIEAYKKQDVIIGPPMHSGKAIKHLSTLAKYDMMMFGTDDLVWHTKGWDEKFRNAMPEHGLSVLYPSTLPNQNAKAMVPVFTRKFVEATGLFPDYFEHFGPDTWVVSIARLAGTLQHVKEVYIEHQKVHDVTYSRSRSGGDSTRAKKYLDGSQDELKKLAEKLKRLISGD